MSAEQNITPDGTFEAPTDEAPPLSPDAGVNSFLLIPREFEAGESQHEHFVNTNHWGQDAPSPCDKATHSSESSPTHSETEEPEFQQLPKPQIDPELTAAQSASLMADEATSQWGEEDNPTSGTMARSQPLVEPTTAARFEPCTELLTECIPRSPKLASSFCSQSSQGTSLKPEQKTKSDGSDNTVAGIYDSDWMWFAVGALTVAGAMLAGKHFYKYVQRSSGETARC